MSVGATELGALNIAASDLVSFVGADNITVVRIWDQSGLGNHIDFPVADAQPLIATAGVWNTAIGTFIPMTYDGVDDGWLFNTGLSTLSFFITAQTTDDPGIIGLYDSTDSKFFGAFASGVGTSPNTSAGTPLERANGVQKTTRGALYTALSSVNPRIYSACNADISGWAASNRVRFGDYSAAGYAFAGKAVDHIIYSSDKTASVTAIEAALNTNSWLF